jgi:hypothetical protein
MSRPTMLCTIEPVASGAADAQLVVLGPSLGTTTGLWDGVVERLAANYRVLRFDLPGHGFSPAARQPFSIADLAETVIDLVDSVGGGAFHYAGISASRAAPEPRRHLLRREDRRLGGLDRPCRTGPREWHGIADQCERRALVRTRIPGTQPGRRFCRTVAAARGGRRVVRPVLRSARGVRPDKRGCRHPGPDAFPALAR